MPVPAVKAKAREMVRGVVLVPLDVPVMTAPSGEMPRAKLLVSPGRVPRLIVLTPSESMANVTLPIVPQPTMKFGALETLTAYWNTPPGGFGSGARPTPGRNHTARAPDVLWA